MTTRRETITLLAGTALAGAAKDPVIDTHIHLFEPDQFPYHAAATYQPPAEPLEKYLRFAQAAGVDHAIIVHPEPYQDDHRYLEHCFAQERPRGLFKGTCLFDPIDPATPGRMAAIAKRNPGRIVALRIHATDNPGDAPTRSGAIKNRDLKDAAMKKTWAAAGKLGMAVQMHFAPHHAAEVAALVAEFKDVPVILDHMGRFGQGGPAAIDDVVRIASASPRVYFKFSGWSYSSKQPAPHRDMEPVLRKAVAAFGAQRILWGGLGHSLEDNRKAKAVFDAALGWLPAADQALIRGTNAAKLYRF